MNGIGHRTSGTRDHRNRGIDWEFRHVCVEDYTRLAFVGVLEDENGVTAVALLHSTVARFAERCVTVERLMTDSGLGHAS